MNFHSDEYIYIRLCLIGGNIMELESTWEIAYDGYYPYCKNCGYEPDYSLVETLGSLPSYCPKCEYKMINYKNFKIPRR